MKKLSIKEMAKKRKKKGFTLIELIIVIALIAILAAMAIPKFGAARASANKKTDVATAKNIATAVATRIAEGKITPPKASVTYADYQDALDGKTAPTPKATTGNFDVVVDGSGNITISVGSTANEVYPSQTGVYAS